MENENMKTMRQLAQDALLVLNAGNLIGMVNSFARILSALQTHLQVELGDRYTTEALARHPVSILFSQAISNVTKWDCCANFGDAYEWAEKQANSDELIAYPETLLKSLKA